MSFEKAIIDHIDWLMHARGRSPHTLRAYSSDLSKFALYCKSSDQSFDSPVTYAHYIRYLMLEKGASPRTLKRKMACFSGFFKRAVRLGELRASPADAIDIILPKTRTLPRALSREDASCLVVEALKRTKVAGDKVQFDFSVAVLLLLATGLRISELLSITTNDFDATDGALIVTGKGQRERRVFVVDPVLLGLLRIVSSKTEGESFFFSGDASMSAAKFRRYLKSLSVCAGLIYRVTPHMLRHTAATLLLEDGVDILFLQRLLGHQNISTTALYAHVGNASLKNALKRADLIKTLAA